MSETGRRPTIRDVADRAGVSKSLVSMVLRGKEAVSDESRSAVLRAVEQLGYRPNAMARGLVEQRSHVIGVLLSDLHNPFFAEVVDGISEAAEPAGFNVILISGFDSRKGEAAALEALLEMRVEGVIATGQRIESRRLAAAGREVPVVTVGRIVRQPGVDVIVNDDRRGVRLAVQHLNDLGHRAIAHVDGGGVPAATVRRRAYERTMEDLGLQSHIRVARGSFTEEGGAAGIRELLDDTGPLPTAILMANDYAAIGGLSELELAGYDVPEDISLVGYDNTTIAALRHIDLTTVDQARREMGRRSVDLLLERLDGTRTERARIVTEPTLAVRGTTARPRSTNGGDG